MKLLPLTSAADEHPALQPGLQAGPAASTGRPGSPSGGLRQSSGSYDMAPHYRNPQLVGLGTTA